MNEHNQLLTMSLLEYANNSLREVTGGEGTNVLSALVNLVDSVVEGSVPQGEFMSQEDRERMFVNFLVSHDTENAYTTS